MKDCVILTLIKEFSWKMAKVENDLDIYYAVGNANTQRQENQLCSNYEKTQFCRMEVDLNKHCNSWY